MGIVVLISKSMRNCACVCPHPRTADRQVVKSQLLVELEEALEYRMSFSTESGEARRQIISQVWTDRLSAASAHLDVCRVSVSSNSISAEEHCRAGAQILQIRTLARDPREDVPSVHFACLVRLDSC